MIIDTSALIAILRDEPEAAACAEAIEAAKATILCTPASHRRWRK